ncbi:MAG: DUF2382 domain-containing protein [Bryobacteraceae bacterium]
MAELQEFEVRLSSGLKGTVLRTSRFLDKREFNTIKLSNGTELTVPSAALKPQQDGSFYLHDVQAQTGAQPENGSKGSGKDVPSDDGISVDARLFKEDIDVQRVPVNRVLDAPAEIRIEDGVTIIPVMEERLKIEKQLILREEIRIVKKRTTVRDPRVTALAKDRGDVNAHGEPER